MKTTYTNGHLNIHVGSLLDHLDDEAKLNMIQHLACEASVIKAVTEEIIDGMTEEGWHGATSAAVPNPHPSCGLDWARREVARRAGDVAAKEIERLEEALEQAHADIEYYRDKGRRPW